MGSFLMNDAIGHVLCCILRTARFSRLRNSENRWDRIHGEHEVRELDAHEAKQERRGNGFSLAPEPGEETVAVVLVDCPDKLLR